MEIGPQWMQLKQAMVSWRLNCQKILLYEYWDLNISGQYEAMVHYVKEMAESLPIPHREFYSFHGMDCLYDFSETNGVKKRIQSSQRM